MSLLGEVLFTNYWEYQFDNVLLGFHILIDIVIDSFELIKMFWGNFSFSFYYSNYS
jgi:hypothetical protein